MALGDAGSSKTDRLVHPTKAHQHGPKGSLAPPGERGGPVIPCKATSLAPNTVSRSVLFFLRNDLAYAALGSDNRRQLAQLVRAVLLQEGGPSVFFCAVPGENTLISTDASFPVFNLVEQKGLEMVPTLALREQAMKLLAADTTTLAQAADANLVALVMNAFTPAENLLFADLDLATFDGSTPLEIGLGAQAEGLNPGTNDAVIDLKVPVGGLRWETTGTTNLPQTIYGFILTKNDGTTLLASGLLANPITLTGINQRVEGLDSSITQLANSMS